VPRRAPLEALLGTAQEAVALTGLVLPDARVNHCQRDPVDTCLSCYTKLFAGEQPFAYDQIEVGRFFRAHHALMTHWRATLPPSHFLEVDYDAVEEDIEREARRMPDFLGLSWNERVMRFHETERPSAHRERQSGTPTNLSHFAKALAEARGAFATAARGARRLIRIACPNQLFFAEMSERRKLHHWRSFCGADRKFGHGRFESER
jgi:Sulfotransferase family